MSESYEISDVEQCTVDAIGEPGDRTFFLQAAGQGRLVTLKLEKQQVAALAHYLRGALDDLPELDPGEHVPAGGLIEPVEAEWVIGSLGVAFDDSAARFVIAAEELVDEDDPVADPGRARISLTRGQVAGFIEQAEAAVEGGRPPCPICGRPMDPSGHICPRSNGHGVH